MKTKEDAVMELLEFCLKNNYHPSELFTFARKNYKGHNPHHLVQEARRNMKPLSF